MATAIDQLEDIEQQLSRIGRQVAGLRSQLATGEVDQFSPRPHLPSSPIPLPSIRPVVPTTTTEPALAEDPITIWAPATPMVLSTPKAVDDRPLLDRIGPMAFAWAGGIAMFLGIVFFFVLAVRRGWVDEQLRVILGLGVSAGLLGVALRLRRAIPDSPAPVVCAAVAVGGLFTTLVAATRIYGFVPVPAGLVLAQVIGALAVGIAIRWKTEIVASLGLVGAMFAAPLVGASADSAGLALVAVAFAAAATVTFAQRWSWTAIAAMLVVAPQALLVIGHTGLGGDAWTLLTLALVGATALAAGTLWQLRSDSKIVDVTVVGAAVSLIVGMVGALDLFASDAARGSALAVVAVAHLAAAVMLWRAGRQVATALIGSAALAMGAAAIALVLDGLWRVAALGGLATGLAWLARRVADQRIFAASGVGLAVAAMFAMIDAPPSALFDRAEVPGLEVVGLAILAVAVAVSAWFGRDHDWSPVAAWTALATSLLAVSALIVSGIVAIASPAGLDIAFQRAHLTVSLVWAIAGLALLWHGIRRSSTALRHGGTVLLVAALGKLFLFDLANLQAMARALSFLVVGAIVLAGAIVVGRVTADDDVTTSAESVTN